MKGVGLVEDIMSEEDCLSYLASLFLQSDSSEDEEVACWKAALRQHVEEVRSHYSVAAPCCANAVMCTGP